MNKYFYVIILVILIVSLFFVFKGIKTNNNKEIDFTYKLNAGIPFKWEYKISDEKIVKFVKQYVKEDNNNDSGKK